MTIPENIAEKDEMVVKFVGDSGDGMQLIGTLFSDAAAIEGNDLATFPDFPAEIRAPHNTVAGVSGFQVHLGKTKIYSPGDMCDLLVAMNAASLKANLKWVKKGATIIVDESVFDEKSIEKAGYTTNPLEDESLSSYNLIKAPITLLTKECLAQLNSDSKAGLKSKNMFALGMVNFLFGKNLNTLYKLIEQKFGKSPKLVEVNKAVLTAGYNYAEITESTISNQIKVGPAKLEKGKYRNITGNIATAWGLLAASERSKRPLFLGSYPITPATEILMELAKQKSLGVKVLQAEDEIAGICSAIGASFTGSLAVTTTSGPGFSLKSEAIGLAVMTELPLVIVNVQRAGPSTGMPTKSEQSDLMQVLFGRNGEAPLMVLSASTPANCFYYAYMASKYAMEHMTPVVLLTEGCLGFGTELFKISKIANLPDIDPPIARHNEPDYKPYNRDPDTFVRKWALPGTEGLRHRIGGLEKENIAGNVTTDPMNHQLMVQLREQKIEKIADFIPLQKVEGEGDLLVVSWGSTYGAIRSALTQMEEEGAKVGHAHFHYINPLPKNTAEVFSKFKKIIVCELNNGQFVNFLRMKHPEFRYEQFNKVQGLPFMVTELKEQFNKILEGK